MQSPLWRPKFRRLSQLGPQNLHYLVFFFEFLYTLGHLILLLHPHLLCYLGKWKTEKGFLTCQGWEHFQQLLQSPYKICTVGYFTLFWKKESSIYPTHMPVYHCHKPVLLGKWPLLQVCYKPLKIVAKHAHLGY